MPYDPSDPFDLLNPQATLDNLLKQRQQQAAQQNQPSPRPVIPHLDPAEEQGLFSKLGDTALTGLGYVGDVLDKTFGGRAIRGALGGNARELASIIPGSDALGITDPGQRVSGETLLKNAGLLEGEGTKGEFELRDLAGPLAEMALDPGSYLSFGANALTKAGIAAAKKGQLASTYAGRIAAKQANLVGIGLPFMGSSGLGVGTGATAQRIAGGVDKAFDWAAYGNPVGRSASALFDPRVLGDTDAANQRILRQMFPEQRRIVADYRGQAHDIGAELRAGGQLDNSAALRSAVEGTADLSTLHPSVVSAAQKVKALQERILGDTRAAGIPLAAYGEDLPFNQGTRDFSTRTRTLPPVSPSGQNAAVDGGVFSTDFGQQQGRKSLLKGYEQGTGGVNALWADPELSGPNSALTQRVNALAPDVIDRVRSSPAYLAGNPQIGPATPASLLARQIAPEVRDALGLDAAGAAERTALGREYAGARRQAVQSGRVVSDFMAPDRVARLEELSHPHALGLDLTKQILTSPHPDDVLLKQIQGTLRGELGGRQIGEQYLGMTPERRAEAFVSRDLNARLPGYRDTLENQIERLTGPGGQAGPLRQHMAVAKIDETLPPKSEWLNGVPPANSVAQVLKDARTVETRGKNAALRVADLTPQEQRLGLFGNHTVADLAGEATAAGNAQYHAKVLSEILGQKAVVGAHQFDSNTVPITRALKKLGLTATDDTGLIAERNLLQRLDPSGALKASQVGLPQKELDRLLKMNDRLRVPEASSGILAGIDSMRNLFKAHVTSPFLSFLGRNFAGGVFNNVKESAFTPSAYKDALAIYHGKAEIPGTAGRYFKGQGLSDAEATQRLGRELFSQDVFHGGMTQASDLAHAAAGTGPAAPLRLPGLTDNPGLWQIAKNYLPRWEDVSLKKIFTGQGTASPVNVSGVGGLFGMGKRNADTFAPVRAGRQANELVEQVNRGTAYLAKRGEGLIPEEAARVSDRAHFDYGLRTNFERDVMSRLMPFYTFQSRNLLRTGQDLVGNPSGAVGRLTALNADARHNNDTFVPPYLGSGVAIPLTDDANGQQRFLTQFGTPFESAFDWLKPKGVSETLQGAASQLDPLLKGPLEVMAGKQFYSGRDLNVNDLYGPTGNTLLEQGLSNSPAARLYTTYKTLTDQRKGLFDNLLGQTTGLKVSDVDVLKQKDQLVRQLLEDRFKDTKGIGAIQDYYVKPDEANLLSPDDLKLYSLYRDITKRQKERGKALAGPVPTQ